LVLIRLHPVEENLALAIRVGSDFRVSNVGIEHRISDWARRAAECCAEVFAREVFADAFGSGEEEELIFLDGSTEAAAKLIAAEIIERLAIGGRRGQSFGAEVFETAPMEAIGAGLGDDVDYAAGCATKFRVRAAGHNLEFLDGFEADVHRGALPADLFAEEAVVVVAAVQAAVIEDAALAVDVAFVVVGAIRGDDDGVMIAHGL